MATKEKTKAGRVAERKTSRSQSPNRKKETQAASPSAIDLLEQDHREVEEWFDEYDGLKEDDDRKAELAQKICLALKVHAQIEEEIFYPQAREATKDSDLIDEALVEHATVKNLIAEIESMAVGEDLYDAKIRVLGEMVKQHIKEEEEEEELFPELEPAKMDVEAFGKELAERKEELSRKCKLERKLPVCGSNLRSMEPRHQAGLFCPDWPEAMRTDDPWLAIEPSCLELFNPSYSLGRKGEVAILA